MLKTCTSRAARAALLIAPFILSACSKEPATSPDAQEAAGKPKGAITLSLENIDRLGLRVAPAQAATEVPLVVAPAVIAPPPNSRVAVAATFPGIVTNILVVEGATVSKGQPLAIVSSRDVLSMGAALTRASARLDVARSNANRLDQLHREGIVAGARMEEAKAVLGEARADANEKIRILKMVNGSGTAGTYTLTAPIAGKVTKASIEAGTVLDGSMAPYVIDAVGAYEAQAQLPERLIGKVYPGMAVSIGDSRGKVTAVGSTIDLQTRSVALKARLEAGPDTLSGRATTITIFGPAPAGAVMIDSAAVTSLDGGDGVFVRTASGVVARPIKVGGRNGDKTLVLSGLKAGENVVVAGTSALKPLVMGE